MCCCCEFRFELPTSEHVLGLPTASHIVAVDNAMVYREYTPITLDQCDKGYFDLVVKRYPGAPHSVDLIRHYDTATA